MRGPCTIIDHVRGCCSCWGLSGSSHCNMRGKHPSIMIPPLLAYPCICMQIVLSSQCFSCFSPHGGVWNLWPPTSLSMLAPAGKAPVPSRMLPLPRCAFAGTDQQHSQVRRTLPSVLYISEPILYRYAYTYKKGNGHCFFPFAGRVPVRRRPRHACVLSSQSSLPLISSSHQKRDERR
jgi:hypothetical protein